MTITARFKAESFGGGGQDGRILSKATGIQEQDHYWILSTWRVGRAIRLRFRLKAGDLKLGVWTHVVAVYDGKLMKLYKDGRLVGSIAKTGIIDTNANVSVWIGDNPPEVGSRPWNGLLDDVRIYNRALAESEISELSETPR